jgi:hypothetical protein
MKKMGNINERFKQIESAFEGLLDKTAASNEPNSSLSQPEKPLADLNHTKTVDLSINYLDTFQLTRILLTILDKHNLSQSLFAKQVLKIDLSQVNRLINYPKQWTECSDAQRMLYYKIHDWCESTEAIQALLAFTKTNQWKRNQVSNLNNLPQVPDHLQLDTKKVAQVLKKVLASNCITNRSFADRVVSINPTKLSCMLNEPKPWPECTEYKKKLYLRIHQWCNSPKEIKSFKTLNS